MVLPEVAYPGGVEACCVAEHSVEVLIEAALQTGHQDFGLGEACTGLDGPQLPNQAKRLDSFHSHMHTNSL